MKPEGRPSNKIVRTSKRPSLMPKRRRDAEEGKLARLRMPLVEAHAERTELLAKPGESKEERQGSPEESRSR